MSPYRKSQFAFGIIQHNATCLLIRKFYILKMSFISPNLVTECYQQQYPKNLFIDKENLQFTHKKYIVTMTVLWYGYLSQ